MKRQLLSITLILITLSFFLGCSTFKGKILNEDVFCKLCTSEYNNRIIKNKELTLGVMSFMVGIKIFRPSINTIGGIIHAKVVLYGFHVSVNKIDLDSINEYDIFRLIKDKKLKGGSVIEIYWIPNLKELCPNTYPKYIIEEK